MSLAGTIPVSYRGNKYFLLIIINSFLLSEIFSNFTTKICCLAAKQLYATLNLHMKISINCVSDLLEGNVYNIPVCLWLLDTYPYNPPICFVKPTSAMMIKTGKHIDANGKIYLPYLHEWKHVSVCLYLFKFGASLCGLRSCKKKF